MKKILIAAAAALTLAACSPKADSNVYTINGKVDGNDGMPVYLLTSTDTIGTDTIRNGGFTFNGIVEQSKEVAIGIDSKSVINFYLEPGTISLDIDSATVSGSPLYDEMKQIEYELMQIQDKIYGEEAKQDSLWERYYAIIDENCQKHAGDPLGLTVFQIKAQDLMKSQIDSVMALYPLYAEDPELKELVRDKAIQEKTFVGNKYVDIIGINARTDQELSLSDVVAKGKPVIVDFMASWCAPCHQEIKEYLSKYAREYRKKVNFVSVAVWEKSIDDTRKAMHKLPISWPVIYADDNGEPATSTYGIDGIPYIMLIAPDGTILARDIRGEQIKEAIDKALAKK